MIFIGGQPQAYELDVTQGKIPGHEKIDKFGRNGTVSDDAVKQTVCEGCDGLYNYSFSADIESASSSSTGDTQDLVIEGLDGSGNFLSQELTLTGQTRVAIQTPLWRVFRMYQKDSTDYTATDFNGVVYCYTGTTNTNGVPTSVAERARIDDGNNQTLMALYTIPRGKVGFLYRGEVGIGFNGAANAGTQSMYLHYRSRRAGSIFKTKKAIDVISAATSMYQDSRSFPDIVPALTDVEITKINASGVMSVWATLDFELVDENMFSVEYLAAIGQAYTVPSPPDF